MSYKYEKNKNGDQDLVISGWEKGIADSPYNGFQMLQNLNISYQPGGVYLNISRDASTYTVSRPTKEPTYIVQDPTFPRNLYAVDLGGVVWQSVNGGVQWSIVASSPTGNAGGNGIAVWNSYLIVARGDKLDAIAVTTGGATGPSWTTFATFGTAAGQFSNHFALIANDTKLYFCNGNAIASLAQLTVFDPTSAPTFSYNDTALTLPFRYYNNTISTGMCELGNNLLISAGNYVYPWDKNSPSYNIPIPFPEPIYKIYNINNFVYCFAGISLGTDYNVLGRGNIYLYNGYQPSLFKKMPDLSGSFTSGDTQNWYFGGVSVYYGKLLFGVRNNGTSSSGAFNGIYSLDSNAVLNFEYTDSEGTAAGTSLTTALCTTYGNSGDTIQSFSSGWRDDVSFFGFAITNQSGTCYSSGVIRTDLIPVGTTLQPTTYKQIELKFNQPLASGEGFSINGKADISSSQVIIKNNYISLGGESVSYNFPMTLEKLKWLQIVVTLNGVASGSRCPLTEIRLIP